MKKQILLLAFLILYSSLLFGQKSISNFSLSDAQSGGKTSLSAYSSNAAVVVIFTSNYCPYSKLYEARIAKLSQDFQGKNVAFILINPNNPAVSPEDAFDKMKEKSSVFGGKIPYLADPNQEIARLFDAKRTPEVFLLKPSGGNFTVVYNGAIDDNPQSENEVGQQYLAEAINKTIGGSTPTEANQRPTGCMIRGN
jgi:thiol-disulfide isomerase/thioredoxin